MTDTSIEWCQRPGTRARSWNPTQGCSMVSEGCRNCYAMRMAARFAKDGWSKGLINLRTGKWSGDVRMADHKLADPLRWREPSTVFVNSMSDLFHEDYTNEQIAAVIGVIAACPQHTFIVVTKRAKRMRDWFAWVDSRPSNISHGGGFEHPIGVCARAAAALGVDITVSKLYEQRGGGSAPWPLPNLWLLVSTENQEAANERIPYLLETPAVVRGVSAEPLLGDIDFTLRGTQIRDWDEDLKYDTLEGSEWCSPRDEGENDGKSPKLDWVIAGCESGAGARPCDVAWLRSLRDQCKAAEVPFFLKQAGDEDACAECGDVLVDNEEGDPSCTCTGRPGSKPAVTGPGSRRKPGGVISTPFLDGRQHIAWP